jgi:hypothetical protein
MSDANRTPDGGGAVDLGLTQALDARGEGVHVVGDLAARAIRRDTQLRRRRTAAVGVAAALVLAVGVPVGWAALAPTPDRTVPVAPSTTRATDAPTPSAPVTPSKPTAPTPAPTLTADGSPAPATLRPATGDPTATTEIPYLVDGVIHDGTKQEPVGSSASGGFIARLAGGRWLVQSTTGAYQVRQPLDLPTIRLGTGTVTVSTDGTLFVIENLGTLRAYDASGTLIRTLRAPSCDCTPTGLSNADSPGFQSVGIIGSVVYANRGYRLDGVAWDVTTGARRAVGHRLALVDAASGTALTAPDPNTPSSRTCHDLLDLTSDRTLWHLCGPLLFRSFSADGRYLLATGEIDGLGDSELNPDRTFRYGGLVVVRTSDAAVVLEGRGDATTGAGSPVSYRMGSDDTVTVQVGGTAGTRSLQRCTLDGACEVVAPQRPRDQVDIPEGDDPYHLSTN